MFIIFNIYSLLYPNVWIWKSSQEKQKAFEQLQNVLAECSDSGAFDSLYVQLASITAAQNGLALFTNSGLFEIFANGFVDEYGTRITDEQKQCIQVSQFVYLKLISFEKNTVFTQNSNNKLEWITKSTS